MSVAKVTEITAGSPKGFDDAVRQGLARASKTLKNIHGAWIAEQKVVVNKSSIEEWRVTMRISFILED